MARDGKVIIDATLDTEQFEKNMKHVEKVVTGSAKKISDELGDAASSATKIKIEPTTKGIKEAEKELQALEKQYDELAQAAEEARQFMNFSTGGGQYNNTITQAIVEDYEKAAQAADEAAKKILAMEDAISAAQREMENGRQATDKLANETDALAQAQKEAARQTEIMTTFLQDYVLQAVDGAVSAMNDLVTGTMDFRKEMASLETNSSRAGVSIEVMEGAMSDLYSITGETDSNLEGLSNLLEAGFDDSNMAEIVERLSDAVLAFPDTLKFESLSDGLQETLATGKAIGPFAELLDRTGVDLDKFNSGLERATRSGREQEYVLKTLAKNGLAGTTDAYRENNRALTDAYEAEYNFMQAQARVGEALQPSQTAIDNAKTSLLNFTAEALEAAPGLGSVVLAGGELISAFGNIAFTVNNVWQLLKNLNLGGFVGNLTKSKDAAKNMGDAAKDAGNSAESLGKKTSEAGDKVQGANTKFLSIAGGVAIMAAGLSLAVLSATQLVKAFGETDNMLETAGAVSIVVVALTGAIAAMTALYKLVGQNSTQFLTFSAGIVVVSAALALALNAVTGLVEALNDSDTDIREVAISVSIMVGVLTGAISVIALLGTVLGNAAPQLIMFGAALLVVAAALMIAAAAVAMLRGDFAKINQVRAPTIGELQGSVGYAHGTASARRGYNWVDETTDTPRLLYFNGGEQVLTRAQSMARQNAIANTGSGTVRNYYIAGISIPADNVRSFVQVIDIMENEAASIQQGYAGGI